MAFTFRCAQGEVAFLDAARAPYPSTGAMSPGDLAIAIEASSLRTFRFEGEGF